MLVKIWIKLLSERFWRRLASKQSFSAFCASGIVMVQIFRFFQMFWWHDRLLLGLCLPTTYLYQPANRSAGFASWQLWLINAFMVFLQAVCNALITGTEPSVKLALTPHHARIYALYQTWYPVSRLCCRFGIWKKRSVLCLRHEVSGLAIPFHCFVWSDTQYLRQQPVKGSVLVCHGTLTSCSSGYRLALCCRLSEEEQTERMQESELAAMKWFTMEEIEKMPIFSHGVFLSVLQSCKAYMDSSYRGFQGVTSPNSFTGRLELVLNGLDTGYQAT